MSAEEFLCRIREMRYNTVLSDADLLGALPDLMTGIAFQWQRQQRDRWRTWADFEETFRRRYSDVNFHLHVAKEAFKRTQREYEPLLDYVVNYRSVLAHMRPAPTKEEQLSLTYYNLHDEYQRQFRRSDFPMFEELEDLGKLYE